MADTYSMTGSKYSDRGEAQKLSSLIYDNPAMGAAVRQASRRGMGTTYGYLAEGLPYDIEGLASAYALKYGQSATEKLMEALPHMRQSDLVAVMEDVGGAADEADSMRRREEQSYERAGMQNRQGQYQR